MKNKEATKPTTRVRKFEFTREKKNKTNSSLILVGNEKLKMSSVDFNTRATTLSSSDREQYQQQQEEKNNFPQTELYFTEFEMLKTKKHSPILKKLNDESENSNNVKLYVGNLKNNNDRSFFKPGSNSFTLLRNSQDRSSRIDNGVEKIENNEKIDNFEKNSSQELIETKKHPLIEEWDENNIKIEEKPQNTPLPLSLNKNNNKWIGFRVPRHISIFIPEKKSSEPSKNVFLLDIVSLSVILIDNLKRIKVMFLESPKTFQDCTSFSNFVQQLVLLLNRSGILVEMTEKLKLKSQSNIFLFFNIIILFIYLSFIYFFYFLE